MFRVSFLPIPHLSRLLAAKAKGSWWTMALEVLSSMPKSQVCPGKYFVCNVCDVFVFYFFEGAEGVDGTLNRKLVDGF